MLLGGQHTEAAVHRTRPPLEPAIECSHVTSMVQVVPVLKVQRFKIEEVCCRADIPPKGAAEAQLHEAMKVKPQRQWVSGLLEMLGLWDVCQEERWMWSGERWNWPRAEGDAESL